MRIRFPVLALDFLSNAGTMGIFGAADMVHESLADPPGFRKPS